MSDGDVKPGKEAAERHAKAMQWLREKCIQAHEKYEHLFPLAEAELKQAELERSKPKAPPQPRRHAAKRVRRQAKNLTR